MYRSLYRIAHPLAKTAAFMSPEELDAGMQSKNKVLHFGKDGVKFVNKDSLAKKATPANKKSLYEQVREHPESVKWLKDRGVDIEDFSPEKHEELLSRINDERKKYNAKAKNPPRELRDNLAIFHKADEKMHNINPAIKPGRPWMRRLGIGLAASGLAGLGLAAYRSSRQHKNRDHRS